MLVLFFKVASRLSHGGTIIAWLGDNGSRLFVIMEEIYNLNEEYFKKWVHFFPWLMIIGGGLGWILQNVTWCDIYSELVTLFGP